MDVCPSYDLEVDSPPRQLHSPNPLVYSSTKIAEAPRPPPYSRWGTTVHNPQPPVLLHGRQLPQHADPWRGDLLDAPIHSYSIRKRYRVRVPPHVVRLVVPSNCLIETCERREETDLNDIDYLEIEFLSLAASLDPKKTESVDHGYRTWWTLGHNMALIGSLDEDVVADSDKVSDALEGRVAGFWLGSKREKIRISRCRHHNHSSQSEEEQEEEEEVEGESFVKGRSAQLIVVKPHELLLTKRVEKIGDSGEEVEEEEEEGECQLEEKGEEEEEEGEGRSVEVNANEKGPHIVRLQSVILDEKDVPNVPWVMRVRIASPTARVVLIHRVDDTPEMASVYGPFPQSAFDQIWPADRYLRQMCQHVEAADSFFSSFREISSEESESDSNPVQQYERRVCSVGAQRELANRIQYGSDWKIAVKKFGTAAMDPCRAFPRVVLESVLMKEQQSWMKWQQFPPFKRMKAKRVKEAIAPIYESRNAWYWEIYSTPWLFRRMPTAEFEEWKGALDPLLPEVEHTGGSGVLCRVLAFVDVETLLLTLRYVCRAFWLASRHLVHTRKFSPSELQTILRQWPDPFYSRVIAGFCSQELLFELVKMNPFFRASFLRISLSPFRDWTKMEEEEEGFNPLKKVEVSEGQRDGNGHLIKSPFLLAYVSGEDADVMPVDLFLEVFLLRGFSNRDLFHELITPWLGVVRGLRELEVDIENVSQQEKRRPLPLVYLFSGRHDPLLRPPSLFSPPPSPGYSPTDCHNSRRSFGNSPTLYSLTRLASEMIGHLLRLFPSEPDLVQLALNLFEGLPIESWLPRFFPFVWNPVVSMMSKTLSSIPVSFGRFIHVMERINIGEVQKFFTQTILSTLDLQIVQSFLELLCEAESGDAPLLDRLPTGTATWVAQRGITYLNSAWNHEQFVDWEFQQRCLDAGSEIVDWTQRYLDLLGFFLDLAKQLDLPPSTLGFGGCRPMQYRPGPPVLRSYNPQPFMSRYPSSTEFRPVSSLRRGLSLLRQLCTILRGCRQTIQVHLSTIRIPSCWAEYFLLHFALTLPGTVVRGARPPQFKPWEEFLAAVLRNDVDAVRTLSREESSWLTDQEQDYRSYVPWRVDSFRCVILKIALFKVLIPLEFEQAEDLGVSSFLSRSVEVLDILLEDDQTIKEGFGFALTAISNQQFGDFARTRVLRFLNSEPGSRPYLPSSFSLAIRFNSQPLFLKLLRNWPERGQSGMTKLQKAVPTLLLRVWRRGWTETFLRLLQLLQPRFPQSVAFCRMLTVVLKDRPVSSEIIEYLEKMFISKKGKIPMSYLSVVVFQSLIQAIVKLKNDRLLELFCDTLFHPAQEPFSMPGSLYALSPFLSLVQRLVELLQKQQGILRRVLGHLLSSSVGAGDVECVRGMLTVDAVVDAFSPPPPVRTSARLGRIRQQQVKATIQRLNGLVVKLHPLFCCKVPSRESEILRRRNDRWSVYLRRNRPCGKRKCAMARRPRRLREYRTPVRRVAAVVKSQRVDDPAELFRRGMELLKMLLPYLNSCDSVRRTMMQRLAWIHPDIFELLFTQYQFDPDWLRDFLCGDGVSWIPKGRHNVCAKSFLFSVILKRVESGELPCSKESYLTLIKWVVKHKSGSLRDLHRILSMDLFNKFGGVPLSMIKALAGFSEVSSSSVFAMDPMYVTPSGESLHPPCAMKFRAATRMMRNANQRLPKIESEESPVSGRGRGRGRALGGPRRRSSTSRGGGRRRTSSTSRGGGERRRPSTSRGVARRPAAHGRRRRRAREN